MLILKQNAANTVPTPPTGKGTIFLDDSDTLSVKTSDGNVENFPTVAASNSQVVFMNGTALSGEAALTYDFNTNVLNVTGNVAAGNVLTDNLYYANGVPWDLQEAAGSNNQIQYNSGNDFAASANLTYNDATQEFTVLGNAQFNNANLGNAATANFITGTLTSAAASQPNITGVGTLTFLSVTGNIGAGNISTTGELAGGELSVTGNAVISGNLSVNGNITYVNVDTLQVEDPVISLGGGPNGDPLTSDDGKDRGTALQYYDGSAKTAFMGWDASNSEFGLGSTTSIANDVVTFTTYGNLRVGNIVGATLVAGTLTTAAQPNITSVGTLSSLTVSGNVGAGNVSATDVTGTTLGGSLTTAAQPNITSVGTLTSLSVTGNVSAGNVSGTLLTGTLATAAQPNVTSLGTLSGLAVNGNITAANITANTGVFTGNGSGLSAIAGANVTGTVANATHASTANTITDAAQPNITSVGKLQSVFIGATSNTSDFPNAIAIASQDDTGLSGSENVGLVGEGVGNGVEGIGLLGLARANGTQKATGVQGIATVTSTADTGAAVGVRGYSTTTHSGGYNIAVLGNALGSGVGNYAFYVQNGGIASIENDTFWDLNDDSTTALAFNSSGKANILAISTDDGNEGVIMSGTLEVTGNITATAGLKTDNLYYANGSPWDLQQAAGSNNQIQYNAGDDFAASANLTYDDSTQVFTVLGNGAFNNVNAGNLLTANFVAGTLTTAAQPNVTSVGTLTSLSVTGNVSAGNVDGGNLVSANYISGTFITGSQPNITSVGTLSALSVDGANIDLANGVYVGNGAGLTDIAGANVTGTVANATHASTANTVVDAAQPNITSVGTLTSLSVTGNAGANNLNATEFVTAGNVYANSGTVGASLLTGTLTTAAQPNVTSVGTLSSLAVSGNATAGNVYANSGTIGASLLAGTLTTAAQPNVTSVGTLSSLSVTGNASAGNISTGGVLSVTGNANVGNLGATNVVATDVNATTLGGTLTTAAQPNITSVGTLSSLSVTGNIAAGNLTTTGVLSVTGTGTSSIAGNLDMTSNNISNLATPVNDSDAATKAYVDNLASTGIHYHEPVRVESPTALNASYNNGTAGVGATLTNAGANAALVIDGISLNVADRVLVYTQADQTTNGVYVVTTVGDGSTAWVLTRASDADTYAPSTSTGLDEGSYFFVKEGDTGAGESYVCSTVGTITFGTTNITFAQFSASQVYSAGTGLTLTGTTFSVNASQTQITAVGTLTGLAVNGNITAANITANTGVFTGNGSGLSALAGGNVTGQVGNALVAGTVYTAAQPNITSVGTLTSLAVTGNASAGNISTGGTLSVTGNANVGNIGAAAGVFTSVSGNGSALTALNASNISSGTLAQARLANSSLTVNGTAISLGSSGTITANTTNTLTIGSYLTGGSFNGGSAVTIAVDGTDAATASKVVARDANASFAGNVITATSFVGSGASLTSLNGSNITTGTIAAARVATLNQNTTGYAATVSTAAQPNITSVGTLTSLSVTGNVSGGNLTTTGTVGSSTATLFGDLLTTGANTTAGTVTGNWTLSAGSRWNATYADLAEKYVSDASYEPGTVLVFGGEHEVTIAGEFDSTRVAGVVSTNPAYLMNAECQGEHTVELALQGRVPVKVHGPVAKGDLMVSGPDGHAVANNMARAGTIIGKALENFEGGNGIIEVVVGRF